MIVLHGGPTPNARKIAIALMEMELDWELKLVDILAGDQLTPEFLALNPNNKTPVIVDSHGPHGTEFVLWETGAILLYLADKTGKFIPVDPEERAICVQWLMFQVSGVGPMFGQSAHFTHYARDRHAYAIERYAREVDRLLRVMDKRLAHSEWLGGRSYSIVDMATIPYVRRQVSENPEKYPHMTRWQDALLQRPAVAEGLKVGTARQETIEGGLQGFTDEHRSILWGERQHSAPR